MFDLQFEKIHRYLFPRRYDEETGLPMAGQGAPEYPRLNPDHPRSGIHICRETIFTSGSLAFICYAKNVFSNDDVHSKPVGVKVCLKMTAGVRKGRGSYGSTRVPGETISFECYLNDMVGIWRVLRGQLPSYSIYLPLPGTSPKSFSIKNQPAGSDWCYAEFQESRTSIRVPFDEGAALSFQSVIVAVARTLYPHLDSFAAVAMLDRVDQQPVVKLETGSEEGSDSPSSDSVSTFEPDLKAEGDEEMASGLRKAIYAVCLQTWPKQRKDVAQFIQRHAGQRVGQRILDAANRGDFTELDDLADYLDRS